MADWQTLSDRINHVAPSATLAVDSKAKAMKAAGIDVIGFGAGEPNFPTPAPIVAAAAAAVQKLAGRVNLYVEESAPWNLAKSEETADELAAVIYNALEAIRIIALYMAPFMPNTSAEVFRRLSLGDVAAVDDIEAATAWGQLPAGNAVEIGDPLFPRLDTDAIDLDME